MRKRKRFHVSAYSITLVTGYKKFIQTPSFWFLKMFILLILNFSYHQKVPYDPPDLEVKDKTFGLVAPEEYALPTTAPLWTPVAYAAFDVAMEDKNEKEKKKV